MSNKETWPRVVRTQTLEDSLRVCVTKFVRDSTDKLFVGDEATLTIKLTLKSADSDKDIFSVQIATNNVAARRYVHSYDYPNDGQSGSTGVGSSDVWVERRPDTALVEKMSDVSDMETD